MAAEPALPCDEQDAVFRWRYREAREYGLTMVEARMYAESDIDASLLRKMAKNLWTGAQIAKVLL